MTILRSGSATDVGRVRRINQDLALETPNLYAVADGMGGHVGGEVAARVAVDSLRSSFARQPSTEGLELAVIEANRAVWEQSQSEVDLRGMGTTLTAAALVAGDDGRDVVALANVGDSRAYLFSDGEITQVTLDHSLAEERVRLGEISEAEAAVDPRRHILTRALGVSSDVRVDLWELHLLTGDRLVLCSDGLSNELEVDEMADILSTEPDPAAAAERLVTRAVDHGGSDNVTVVVIDVLLGGDGSTDAEVAARASAAALAAGAAGALAGGVAAAGAVGGPGPAAPAGGAGVTPAADDTQAITTTPGADDTPAITTTPGADDTQAITTTPAESDLTAAVPRTAGQAVPDAGGSADPTIVEHVAAAGAGGALATLTRTGVAAPNVGAAGAPVTTRKETRRERRRRLGVPRRITFRVVLFFVLVAAVFVACYYGIRYYANDNWFVTLKGSQLVIYRGQPGGVLWFKPKLVQQTGVTTAHVLPIRVSDLRQSVDESSLAAARRYVNNLQQEYDNRQALEIPSSTSTSVPGIGPTGIGPSGVLPTEPPTTAPPASTVPGGPTSSTVTTTTTAAGASTTTTASTATTTTVPAATVPTAPSTTDTPGPGAGGTT